MAEGLTNKEISGLLGSSTKSNPLHELQPRVERYTNNFFALEIGGRESAGELFTASGCRNSGGGFADSGLAEKFPVPPSDTKMRRVLELVHFDHEAQDDEVLALYKEPGCESCTYEAGFRFAFRFPEVQRSRRIVFRPEPAWRAPQSRCRRALVLDAWYGERQIHGRFVPSKARRWAQNIWFARFRTFKIADYKGEEE